MSGGGGDNSSQTNMMMMQENARAERQAIADRADREQRANDTMEQRKIDARNQELMRQYSVEDATRSRQYTLDDRTYADNQASAKQAREDNLANTAKQEKADALGKWNTSRDAVYTGTKNDASARLASLGISDPAVASAVMSALNTANASIPELSSNAGGYFDGVVDRVLGQQRDAARTRYGQQLDKVLPNDFAQTQITDETDDSILESILGDQYNSAASDAKRMLDRGAITQEGYNANLKALDQQRSSGRSKLQSMGQNELNAQRTNLTNIANRGRSAASSYELGQNFDAAGYSNQVNSAYDKWFSGLGEKLKGLAPTDLFDTSGFMNTAGNVTGATNSPFVGSTNALTGSNALSDDDAKKKKQATTASAF